MRLGLQTPSRHAHTAAPHGRLEATYEIREDIADVLGRMRPYLLDNDEVGYGGWSKMACKVERFGVSEVRAARVGEARPAAVTGELVVDLAGMREDVRREWEELKQHDVIFLLGLQPPDALAQQAAAGKRRDGGHDGALKAEGGCCAWRGTPRCRRAVERCAVVAEQPRSSRFGECHAALPPEPSSPPRRMSQSPASHGGTV